MKLTIEVVAAGDRLSAGSPVVVQIRDAGLQDAGAVTVAEARTRSRECPAGEPFASATIDVKEKSSHLIVWVHVDVDDSGDVSAGDYITMQSYPVRGESSLRVEVRRVE